MRVRVQVVIESDADDDRPLAVHEVAHLDPRRPGNIILTDEGILGVIDFGDASFQDLVRRVIRQSP